MNTKSILKIIWLVLILVLVVFSAAIFSQHVDRDSNWVAYRNESLGLEIKHPAHLEPFPFPFTPHTSRLSQEISFRSCKECMGEIYVQVRPTSATSIEEVMKDFEKEFANETMLGGKSIGDTRAITTIHYDEPGATTGDWKIFFVKNERFYSLVFKGAETDAHYFWENINVF